MANVFWTIPLVLSLSQLCLLCNSPANTQCPTVAHQHKSWETTLIKAFFFIITITFRVRWQATTFLVLVDPAVKRSAHRLVLNGLWLLFGVEIVFSETWIIKHILYAQTLRPRYSPEHLPEMGFRTLYVCMYAHTLNTHFICQCTHCTNRLVVSGLMSICFLATPKDVSCIQPTYAYYGFS